MFFSLFYIFWYSRFSFRNLKDINSIMILWCIATSSSLTARCPPHSTREDVEHYKKMQKGLTSLLYKRGAEVFFIFYCGGGGKVVRTIFAGELYSLCLLWYMVDMYSKYFLFTSISFVQENFNLKPKLITNKTFTIYCRFSFGAMLFNFK